MSTTTHHTHTPTYICAKSGEAETKGYQTHRIPSLSPPLCFLLSTFPYSHIARCLSPSLAPALLQQLFHLSSHVHLPQYMYFSASSSNNLCTIKCMHYIPPCSSPHPSTPLKTAKSLAFVLASTTISTLCLLFTASTCSRNATSCGLLKRAVSFPSPKRSLPPYSMGMSASSMNSFKHSKVSVMFKRNEGRREGVSEKRSK